MQSWVDRELVAGASAALIAGSAVVDLHCVGWADRESDVALRPDHLFRIFSNTKLATTCAVLLLMEEGQLALDDPVELYLPQLGRRRVLRPGAVSLDDTEAARTPITLRHLLCHSSGLSYGFLREHSLIDKAYGDRGVMNAATALDDMIDVLAALPLAFHPGTRWEYSVATDVLGRVVEVVSGARFDAFLQQRIFTPLAMHDTGFLVPPAGRARLTAYYAGASLSDPQQPGLRRLEQTPFPGAYITPVARYSGGGGLVSSLPDMVTLVRSLLPGGPALLQPRTIALMMENQLPPGVHIGFPTLGSVPGKGYGLGGAVTLTPGPGDPPAGAGEFEWGGIAGTQWWISPRHGIAGVLMSQRQLGFWNPYTFEFKRLAYEALLA